MNGEALALFEFIPAELIHDIGIVVMVLVVARRPGRRRHDGPRGSGGARASGWSDVLGGRAALARTGRCARGRPSRASRSARSASATSASGRTRARPVVPAPLARPRHRRVGLPRAARAPPASTTGSRSLGIKATGTPVPLWYPVRLLGHGRRPRCSSTAPPCSSSTATGQRTARVSDVDDGRLDAARPALGDGRDRLRHRARPLPARARPPWGYWVFLLHVAVAMELVLLAPFMKLAHAVYRPVALFFVALATGDPAMTTRAAPGRPRAPRADPRTRRPDFPRSPTASSGGAQPPRGVRRRPATS